MIIVHPERIARAFTSVRPFAHIAIADPGESVFFRKLGTKKLFLQTEFRDCGAGLSGSMEEKHAYAIAAVARSAHHSGYDMLINCFAGVGRSPSVAMAIADALDLGRAAIQWVKDPHLDPPNRHVYELVVKAFSLRRDS